MKDVFMEKNSQNDTPYAVKNGARSTVLVVEDDAGLNHLICLTLEREGFKTRRVITGAEAIAAARAAPDAVMILDYRLPDMNAMQVITRFREEKIEIPIIITTGYGDE